MGIEEGKKREKRGKWRDNAGGNGGGMEWQ